MGTSIQHFSEFCFDGEGQYLGRETVSLAGLWSFQLFEVWETTPWLPNQAWVSSCVVENFTD